MVHLATIKLNEEAEEAFDIVNSSSDSDELPSAQKSGEDCPLLPREEPQGHQGGSEWHFSGRQRDHGPHYSGRGGGPGGSEWHFSGRERDHGPHYSGRGGGPGFGGRGRGKRIAAAAACGVPVAAAAEQGRSDASPVAPLHRRWMGPMTFSDCKKYLNGVQQHPQHVAKASDKSSDDVRISECLSQSEFLVQWAAKATCCVRYITPALGPVMLIPRGAFTGKACRAGQQLVIVREDHRGDWWLFFKPSGPKRMFAGVGWPTLTGEQQKSTEPAHTGTTSTAHEGAAEAWLRARSEAKDLSLAKGFKHTAVEEAQRLPPGRRTIGFPHKPVVRRTASRPSDPPTVDDALAHSADRSVGEATKKPNVNEIGDSVVSGLAAALARSVVVEGPEEVGTMSSAGDAKPLSPTARSGPSFAAIAAAIGSSVARALKESVEVSKHQSADGTDAITISVKGL